MPQGDGDCPRGVEQAPIPPHLPVSRVTGLDQDSQDRLLKMPRGLWGGGVRREGAPFHPHQFSILLHSPCHRPRALVAGCSVPEDRAGLRRHTKTQTQKESHATWEHNTGSGSVDKGELTNTLPPRAGRSCPAPTPGEHTHSHTHTETHVPADTRSSTHKPADLTLSPEPLTWASTSAPRAEQPPAQGRAAGGGGGRSPGESGQAATNPGGERGGTHVRAGTAGWRASQDIPSHTRGRLGT